MSLASPSMSGGRSHTPVKCISFPLLPCPAPALAARSPRLGEGCWAWGSDDVPRGIPPARLSFRKTSSRRSICLGFFLANSSTSIGEESTDAEELMLRWQSVLKYISAIGLLVMHVSFFVLFFLNGHIWFLAKSYMRKSIPLTYPST